MASYQGHLMFSSALGAAYASVAVWKFDLDWGPAFLGAGCCALGGLLPDLDSDSGVPVRELFNLAAAIIPLFLLHRLRSHFTLEQTIVLLGFAYLLIRYGLYSLFKRWTVHRGMFHSIPAMLIAGLATFLAYYPDPELTKHALYRYLIAGGVALGFLSHLILDELYSVDFMGLKVRLNKFAGSALKFWSPSMPATIFTYVILAGLALVFWLEMNPSARR